MAASPKDIYRVHDIAWANAYIYSDGQEPPLLVRAWYEDNASYRDDPASAVTLQGDGLYSAEQLRLLASDNGEAIDQAIEESGSTVSSYAELNTDPRTISPEAAEAAAHAMARCIFALAIAQQR